MMTTTTTRHYYTKEMRQAAEYYRADVEHTAYMEGIAEIEKLADRISAADTWDMDDLAALCAAAGMEAEWEAADGEGFESVAYAAAEKLGVRII